MPYSGIPKGSETESKVERCVKTVMAKNPSFSKSKAIAICRASIEKREKDCDCMVKNKTKRSRRNRRLRRKQEAREKAMGKQVKEQEETEEEYEDETIAKITGSVAMKVADSLYDEGDEENLKDIAGTAVELLDELGIEHDPEVLAEAIAEEIMDIEEDLEDLEDAEDLLDDAKELVEELTKTGDAMQVKSITINYVDTPGEDGDGTGSFDFDLAKIEALSELAGKPNLIFESVKAKLTSASRNNLPDSAFACIKDGERHLPIHDKAHVRNALARIPQMLKRGGKSAEIARCGMEKVKAAAKKMGIGQPSKEYGNSIVVEKDANDDYRWVGWVSSNFIDRDNEIITEAAHKEYVDFLDKNPQLAPVFMSWHTKGTAREHPVDFWAYENGFLIMSGKLTEKEAEGLLAAQKETKIGMSHGFFAFRHENSKQIDFYRTFEVSDLPLEKASNPWTDLEMVAKEALMEKQDYLAKLLGDEEKAKAIIQATEQKQQELKDAGVQSKETEQETPPTEEAKAAPKVSTDLEEILKAVGEHFDMENLSKVIGEILEENQKIPLLEAALKHATAEVDQKVADLIKPPAAARFNWSRPTEVNKELDLKNEEDAELKKSVAGLPENWLANAFGAQPIQEIEQ